MIGGVAGGMAEYFGIDASLMRLIFILLVLLPGIGVIAYIIAWIVIPEAPGEGKTVKEVGQDIETKVEAWGKEVEGQFKDHHSKAATQRTFGFILVGLGAFFLLRPFLDFDIFRHLWPLVLVVIGLAIIFGRGKRS
jgi:phage shock protein PspC (stress-responsive transcriptional regulator)